jgi:hypothetical protein
LELDERKRELKRERDRVTKDLRNSQKRRDRLFERARGLSDEDLTDILAQRAHAKAKAKGRGKKAKAKAAAKAKAGAEGGAAADGADDGAAGD